MLTCICRPAIGGAALAVVGGTAYLMSDSGPSKKELDELRKRDMESIRQRADEATRQGQEASRQVGGKSDLGAFRNE